MSGQDTKVLLFNTKEFEDNKLYESAYKMVSKYRKEKIKKKKKENLKYLSLGSELVLKYGLWKYYNIDLFDEINFIFNKYNKPYLEKYKDIFFSISHSGEFVCVAFSDSEIGCDIEKIRDIDKRIITRFFTKSEQDKIKEKKDFFTYWTLKESFVKAAGIKLGMTINSNEILEADGYYICKSNDEKLFFLKSFSIPEYKIAVCKKDRLQDIEIDFVDKEKLWQAGLKC